MSAWCRGSVQYTLYVQGFLLNILSSEIVYTCKDHLYYLQYVDIEKGYSSSNPKIKRYDWNSLNDLSLCKNTTANPNHIGGAGVGAGAS